MNVSDYETPSDQQKPHRLKDTHGWEIVQNVSLGFVGKDKIGRNSKRGASD